MKKLPWAALALFGASAVAVNVFVGCGSEDEGVPVTTDDGGDDGGNNGADAFIDAILDSQRGDAATCKAENEGCASSLDCCSTNCALGDAGTMVCVAPIGTCTAANGACLASTECCTLSCINKVCANKQCVADNLACAIDAECCGGKCSPDGTGGGKCTPLSTTCKTAGNPCGAGAECCSKLCNNGVCESAVSFCTQQGDVCADNFECCGGNCVKAAGAALGLCGEPASAPGATQCSVKGTICGKVGDTVPECGGTCCSRVCAPGGAATGFLACQPPSGCSPTGEICRNDSDCCGWSGSPAPLNGPVQCSKSASTQEFGRCDNGTACREPGSICKPKAEACSAENNCCERAGLPSGYCNTIATMDNCCRKDALGIPRCIIDAKLDCATPPPAGTACATSADCCGKPCVGNKCQAACVPTSGACTTNGDCCSGIPCVIPTGSSSGVCGGTLTTDGGVTSDSGIPPVGSCFLYGQACTASSQCCNSVPCTGSVCRYP